MLLGTSLIFLMKLWEQIVTESLFLYSVCTVLYTWKDETFISPSPREYFCYHCESILKKILFATMLPRHEINGNFHFHYHNLCYFKVRHSEIWLRLVCYRAANTLGTSQFSLGSCEVPLRMGPSCLSVQVEVSHNIGQAGNQVLGSTHFFIVFFFIEFY